MSLVGSLEDLGLGDILQIVHLSGKSGVLQLRANAGQGRIVFERGLIRGAVAKGGPTDLFELLESRRAVPVEPLTRAAQDARARGCALALVLLERELIAEAAIDAHRREAIEAHVVSMFRWSSGEFSFEVREVNGAGEDLFVSPGINPQFLALEGTRQVDEGGEAGAELAFGTVDETPAEPGAPGIQAAILVEDPLAAPDFAVADQDKRAPADVIAEATAWQEPPELFAARLTEADLMEPEVEAAAGAEPAATAFRPAPASPPTLPGPRPPLIAIDADLHLLEWVKHAVAADFPRVHVFQRVDLGIERIRQYLARGETPLVLLSVELPPDPLAGARDVQELTARLHRQSPRMGILWLAVAGEKALRGGPKDGRPIAVLEKPSPAQLRETRRREECELRAEDLRRALGDACERGLAAPVRPTNSVDAIARLHEISQRIRERSGRGDVLPQVLAFAAQCFSRVALFMVRDDSAVGIAQVGLSRAGGPDDSGLRSLVLAAREPSWFRAVIDARSPVRSAPTDAGDERLAVMLGNELPAEAYVAPILSGGHVVALLYGDNLPTRARIGDTAALEVALDSASIALDRALLERELAELGR